VSAPSWGLPRSSSGGDNPSAIARDTDAENQAEFGTRGLDEKGCSGGEIRSARASPGVDEQGLILVIEDDEATRGFLADNLPATDQVLREPSTSGRPTPSMLTSHARAWAPRLVRAGLWMWGVSREGHSVSSG
jgi:hypothetical protein